jgi:hypothetical protein
VLAACGWALAAGALAQHGGHDMQEMEDASGPPRLFQSDMILMNGMIPDDPDAGMAMPGWHLMDLGIARLAFNGQGGPSGRKGVESSNWNMFHATHGLWGGRLSLMAMNSLEPATFPAAGSQELFQTGEEYRGKPLVDRQHPHDFFMNLSATWRRQIADRSAVWVQIAPVGEPALGPTAFMHRASAGENPTAPLGHHWQDSTHIAFDVITAGWGWKALSLEGSAFHGAEPDEHRWNIEAGTLDSVSGRARLRLGGGWSGQISFGFLKKPEPSEPGDVHRLTASLHYGADGDGPFAASLVWGRNVEAHGNSAAWLLEAAWQMTSADQVFGRAEYVQKDDDLLAFKGEPHVSPPDEPRLANIFAFTAGYLRDFALVSGLATGLGADVTVYSFPSTLEPAYGHFPLSGHFFLRVRWGAAHGAGHAIDE